MYGDRQEAWDGHKASKCPLCSRPEPGPFGDSTLFLDDPSDVQVLSVGVQLDTCPLILFPVLLCLRDCIFQTPLLAGFQLIIAMKGTCVRSEVRRCFSSGRGLAVPGLLGSG